MATQAWNDEDVADRFSPTVRKRVLGLQLARLRRAAGLTSEKAADELGVGQGHLSQMEHAHRSVNKAQLLALLSIYKVDESKRAELMLLHQTLKQPAWWQGMGVPAGSYVDLEAAAARIRSFDHGVISGLLQTPEYSAEIIRRTDPDADEAVVSQRVSVRSQRSELLADGLKLWTVVDEGALRRIVADRGVMAAQVEHLADRAEQLPEVQVQVLTFDAGAHVSMEGGFAVLEYEDHPTLAYTEKWGQGNWLERGSEVDQASLRWDRLSAEALKPADSIKLLRKLAKELRDG
ncbi:helix-turn-helix transcriptional regulator [Actinocatenispora sera]|uniref:Transcriptional regulator n=1 Tax=Actinocatenispora sera TaxID=390989 RepID=A0A810L6W0_9ACTN|nr:helix-turn-helix transcriptional regulator [Actinocatenispora sera]BCJ29828.1 transcriptional regulator [Actinocatenispora sera]